MFRCASGLCGFYNLNKTDDLRRRNGATYDGEGSGHGKQPKPFTSDWRARIHEIIYRGVRRNPFFPTTYCERRLKESTSLSSDVIINHCSRDVIAETCDWNSGESVHAIESSQHFYLWFHIIRSRVRSAVVPDLLLSDAKCRMHCVR